MLDMQDLEMYIPVPLTHTPWAAMVGQQARLNLWITALILCYQLVQCAENGNVEQLCIIPQWKSFCLLFIASH